MPRLDVRLALTGLVALAILITACATVPITGRKQLSLIPDSQLLSMSFQQYDQVLEESRLSDDPEQVAMIQRVGERIAGAVERYFRQHDMQEQLSGYDWEFHLIESDQVNAWCMPGGKVAFYTGILPICEDEAGVAVVMGHEVAHAVAEHGGERMSQGLVTQLGGVALSEALADKPAETRQLWMTAFAVGAQYGALLPYSRLHESEADELGLIFMAMAGYDPREAPRFWERMQQAGGQAPPEFLSTHPAPDTRIRDLREQMDRALEYYQPGSR
jgi:predicted Zn-dependent protease